MTGIVDDYGRAIVPITVRDPTTQRILRIDAWIDTGFTSSLILLPTHIQQLTPPRIGSVRIQVADGSIASVETYLCDVEWDGDFKQCEVLLADGKFAMIGVGLLEDMQLTIDYPARTVNLSRSPAA